MRQFHNVQYLLQYLCYSISVICYRGDLFSTFFILIMLWKPNQWELIFVWLILFCRRISSLYLLVKIEEYLSFEHVIVASWPVSCQSTTLLYKYHNAPISWTILNLFFHSILINSILIWTWRTLQQDRLWNM